MRKLSLLAALCVAAVTWADVPKFPSNSKEDAQKILIDLVAKGEPAYQELLTALTDKDVPTTANAKFALAGIATWVMRAGAEAERATFAKTLCAALTTVKDADARNIVIQLLRTTGRDEAVVPVTAWLADDASNDYAVRALSSLGATAPLLKALPELKGRSQANVARALGELGVKAAAPGIVPLAASDDPFSREAALYALAELGDPVGQPALAKAAAAPGKLDRAHGTALLLRFATRLGGPAGSAVARKVLAAGESVGFTVDALATLALINGPAAMPDLETAVLSDQAQLRDGTLELLARLPGKPWTDALLAKLAAAAPAAKPLWAKALGLRGDLAAAGPLAGVASGADKPSRVAALTALGSLVSPVAAGALLTALGSDQADEVALAGAKLSQFTTDAGVQATSQALAQAADDATRKQFVARLGQVKGMAAWRPLAQALGTPALAPDAAAALVTSVTPTAPKVKPPLTSEVLGMLKAADAVADAPTKARIATLLGAGPAADTNLAQGKPVLELEDHDGNLAPELAVDGKADDVAKAWGSKGPNTLVVNLGDTYRVGKVQVVFAWEPARAWQYKVDLSEDGKGWTSVVDKSGNTTPATKAGETLEFTGLNARQVKLTVLGNSVDKSVRVVEFRVYPATGPAPLVRPAAVPKPAGANLAEGRPVEASRPCEGANTPERAVDGKVDDPLHGYFSQGTPASLTVDLGESKSLGACQTWFHWSDGRYYQYTIEVSADKAKWTQVVDQSKTEEPCTEAGQVDTFKPVDARYVRINILRNSANPSGHLIEFKVFGAGAAPVATPPAPKPVVALPAPDKDGFVNLLSNKDLTAAGWVGSVKGYALGDDGVLECLPKQGGNLLTAKLYTDFELRFEFKLTPGANNGIGIRVPANGAGNASYTGMELQILDDRDPKYKEWLKDYQCHASLYGCVPAKRDLCKPVGQWNEEIVTVKGRQVTILVNGTLALDVDLDKVTPLDHQAHPGLKSPTGRVGFLGHTDQLWFRNVRIKDLSTP